MAWRVLLVAALRDHVGANLLHAGRCGVRQVCDLVSHGQDGCGHVDRADIVGVVEGVADDVLAVDNEACAHRADTQPLKVAPENLRLAWIKRNAGWACTVELVAVPVGLVDGANVAGRAGCWQRVGAQHHRQRCAVGLKEHPVLGIEVTHALADVGRRRVHGEGGKHQQPLTRLVGHRAEGLPHNLRIGRSCHRHLE